VLKKALQIIVSFSLLVGSYAGYTRLFSVVTELLGDGRVSDLTGFPEVDSKTNQKANEIARESFGQGHWAATNDRKLTYYDDVRGLYMYAQNYELLENNKRIHVWPFAMVWLSKDGVSRKPITSDEAVIDLSQPFGIVSKPGTPPSHIVHAKLLGDVRLRDDKGTRDDPSDDLRVGPLTYIEFDEKTLQITSDSDVYLQDRDLTLTGIGMMIQLRRKVGIVDPSVAQAGGGGGGSGYDAETAFVYKDVHITINNVTSNGVLPGTAKPEKSGKTPLDLRCDREARFDLPRPRPPVLVGPPDLTRPPDPTFAKFKTNVRVIRGSDKTEQLNCDTLDLTLMPEPKPEGTPDAPTKPGGEAGLAIVDATTTPVPEEPDASKAKPSTSGPLTELKIRNALARGDAVWLQSEAQGMVARCVELKYEKHSVEGMPDVTYLNGGTSKKLWVEKVEYDTKATTPGAIKSILELTSLDATIFDYGPGGTSKVIARGPGRTRERPARNASVTRTALWEDEMEMLTWRDGLGPMPAPSGDAARAMKSEPTPVPGTLRRVITLTGVSMLWDHKSATTLDARKSIVAEFQAGPKASPTAGDGPSQIKWLDAYEDAHLIAPSRTLTARQFLKAKFETPPPPPAIPPTQDGVSGPVVASATPTPPPEEKPEPAATPVEPAVDGRADRVWANILLGSNNAKGELKSAQLRGGVMVHQDPSPGKVLGSDASGEALDLTGQGNGLMKFAVKAQEPTSSSDPRTKLASDSTGRETPHALLARVEFEGKTIESEDIIGLDQKADFAWAQGPGIYIQMADRGLLDDKGVQADNVRVSARPSGPTPKDRLVITWNEEMRFYGKSKDLEGRPAAKIEFRGTSKEIRSPNGKTEFRRGVDARMPESRLLCDSMDVYMDRTINLNKDTKKPASKADDPAQQDAQIAMLDCRGSNVIEGGKLKLPGVEIINEKTYPETGEFKEKQRIQGIHVTYDKRTGAFEAPGPGTTWLYQVEGGGPKADGPVPTSAPSNARGPSDVKYANRKPPKLKLTKVQYTEGMRGRFGVARDQVDNQTREALFVGSAEAANAVVNNKNSDIDFDRPSSPDYMFLSSDNLHVFSVPPPLGSKASTRQLLNARGNGVARTIDSLIQADRITYDSASELTYAYGEDGKEVSLTKQDSPGQPPSTARGKTLRYNKATRASDFKDPQTITFTDLKSGIRAKPFTPDVGGSPKKPDLVKPQRMPLQRTPRQSTERKSFTGGT
jgi:hypothetical protein